MSVSLNRDKRKSSPYDLEETKLQAIAALRAHTKVREHKEAGILIRVLRVLEVV